MFFKWFDNVNLWIDHTNLGAKCELVCSGLGIEYIVVAGITS